MPRLTNREFDVMAILWHQGSATVAEVRAELAARGDDLAYTTVLTVLRGLEAKNHVRSEKEGRAHRYRATVRAANEVNRSLTRFLQQAFQGSRELLIARLVEDAPPAFLLDAGRQSPAGSAPPFAGAWGMFSWSVADGNDWRPTVSVEKGVNLLQWVRGMSQRFAEGV